MHDPLSTVILPGAPARALAAGIPLLAAALVASSAARGGLETTEQDVVAPVAVAVATLVVAVVLALRALTQRVELGGDRLVCRNLVTSFALDWTEVEALVVLRRSGTVQVDVRSRSHRRSHRLGAATRFAGEEAAAVLGSLRGHPRAGALLSDDAP